MGYAHSIWHELVGIIGETSAHALTRRLGGQRISIPVKPSKTSSLNFLAECDQYNLSQYLGGDSLEIPLGPPGAWTKRAKVEALLDKGLTNNAIAAQVGCTRRWVVEIGRQKRQDHPDLFE